MYQRILVPLDGSQVAETVLPQAQMLAECAGAEIILLSVLVHPGYDYFIPEPALATAAYQNQLNEMKAYLERTAVRLGEHGLQVQTEICEGRVAEAIGRISVWRAAGATVVSADLPCSPRSRPALASMGTSMRL